MFKEILNIEISQEREGIFMIKAVIFDFDGLLVDTEIISLKIYQEILSEYGFDFTKEEYSKYYSGKTEVENIQRFINTYNLPISYQACLNKVLEVEQKLIAQGVELKSGAKPLLAYLKDNNFKVALATSSTKERAISILKRHNILNYFDEFVFSEDVSSSKPNPEVFLKTCEKLHISTDEAIVLEDSENGIMAACNARISVICIPDMKRPSQEYLDRSLHIFETLNDVIGYLKSCDI